MSAPLIEMRGITKSFGAVKANEAVDLSVAPGEILGLLGENGAGKTTLMNVLFGAYAPDAGEILVQGQPVRITSSADALAGGIGMTTGLVTNLPLADSMVLPRIGTAAFSSKGLLKPDAIRTFAEEQIKAYDIRCPGPMTRAGALSGGNLQKALLARELAFDPKVLIVSQPTRGLDIGAARFIHVERVLLSTALLSGALAGLAGVGEVGGVHFQVMSDISPGYGYSGIVVAMDQSAQALSKCCEIQGSAGQCERGLRGGRIRQGGVGARGAFFGRSRPRPRRARRAAGRNGAGTAAGARFPRQPHGAVRVQFAGLEQRPDPCCPIFVRTAVNGSSTGTAPRPDPGRSGISCAVS